jgi:hypothetical protein
MLGIALGERSMLVAEVIVATGGPEVVKAVEFSYPEGQTLAKDPAVLGAALGAFLKEKGFGARIAVFGLPARWVLSKQKEVPALQDNLLADTLRLQAESEFSSELGELVYDYAGTGGAAASAGGTTTVLLLAVPKRYIDQINQLAEAARIRVQAVTPFSTAVASSAKAAGNAMTLVLGPSGVEFTSQQGGHPRVLPCSSASFAGHPPAWAMMASMPVAARCSSGTTPVPTKHKFNPSGNRSSSTSAMASFAIWASRHRPAS